jgi:elongation factor 1-beta
VVLWSGKASRRALLSRLPFGAVVTSAATRSLVKLSRGEMAVSFANVNSEAGLKKLDEYLLTRSYITGYQASKDDLAVYSSFSAAPSSKYINVARWFSHIDALLRLSGVTAEGQGVKVESSAVPSASTPDVADTAV